MKANFKIPQQNIKATFVPSKNSYTASFSIGGGGVSSDYLLLFNKPLINGVELVGDKNSLELGLASYEQGLLADSALQPNDNISELVNNVGYITGITSSDIQTALGYIPYSAENPSGFITISALNGYATENWVGQQGYLTSSDLSGYATEQWVNNQGFIKGINNTDVITALGYTPYDSANPDGYITSESLPTVNNSTITIQKNGSDIESFNLNQSSNETINITVPTQTSDLTNNSGFITNAVNNLANYYLKSETYTKTEVQQLIASIPQFSVVVVQTLPVTGERMVLYLVPKEGASPDVYNEYIWVEADEDYELIGNTAIDLTDYVRFTDLATVATTGDYDDLSNKPTIPTVGNGTITINQGGTQKGTFTTNQNGNTTIDLDAGGGGGAVDSVNGQTGTVVLTASDVGALPSDTQIGNGTITLTQGGVTKGTLTLNQTGNATIDFDAGGSTITVDSVLSTSSTNPVQNKIITEELNKKIESITSSDVTTALGYTPYNSTNPDGYITSSALNGYATETWVGNQGYLTGITSSDVITALTYTPYNGATNPNGYITSADLPTNYVTTDTAQDISGRKTFLGEKAIYFKQQTTSNKLGFTLYNPSNSELGAFEFRPSTISGGALLNVNVPYNSSDYVGFRYWGTAVNIVAPKVATAGNYFIPTHITDGTKTVTASNTGTVNISTLLPDVSTKQDTLVSGTNIKTINNQSLLGSGNIDIQGGGGGGTDVQAYTATEVETLWESI